MKYCPITYNEIQENEVYSKKGLHLLSPRLTHLEALDLSAAELREEASIQADKLSIQGVQPKLSANLKIKEERFELVDKQGHYILKPQHEYYPELPENEAISMSLASTLGIEVPVHGLVYAKDKSMTYFIKRFDRIKNDKLAVEDFAQLSQESRDTKYNSSMEKVIKILFEFCSFPKVEAKQFFKRCLFNFLIGNEDMHLKNFSLITLDNKVVLAPAYDFLNTTIVIKNPTEELALPLHGKKNNLKKKDFLNYLAIELLKLDEKSVQSIMRDISEHLALWEKLIERSFLSKNLQEKYLKILAERSQRLLLP